MRCLYAKGQQAVIGQFQNRHDLVNKNQPRKTKQNNRQH